MWGGGWWGIHLNRIEMTIDARALTRNGGNGDGGDDDNGNNDGGVVIEASLRSSLEVMELFIRFPSPGEDI